MRRTLEAASRFMNAVLVTGCVALACARASVAPEPAGSRVVPNPIPSTPPVVRRYLAPYAPMPVKVDGRLDDSAWQAAEWSEPFVDIEGPRRPAPRWRTRVKMLWDSTSLYVGAQLE